MRQQLLSTLIAELEWRGLRRRFLCRIGQGFANEANRLLQAAIEPGQFRVLFNRPAKSKSLLCRQLAEQQRRQPGFEFFAWSWDFGIHTKTFPPKSQL